MPDMFTRNTKVEMAPMKEETILFNPANNKFCVLNVTAAFIWKSLEKPQTAQEIAAAVAGHFANVGLQQAEQDVEQTLKELQGVECVVLSQ
jgi:methyltransferase-like protein